MTFRPEEISRLNLLRARAAEQRALAAEVALAKEKQPEFFTAAAAAREAVSGLLPSKLLACGPEVVAAWSEQRRLELIRDGLREAQSRLGSQAIALDRELGREVAEFKQLLTARLKDQPAILEQLAALRAKSGSESTEMLLAICRELGAAIPERES